MKIKREDYRTTKEYNEAKKWIDNYNLKNKKPHKKVFTITKAFIHKYKTGAGGWKKTQLSAIGVSWPPPKGWINYSIGKRITANEMKIFKNNK